VGPGNQTIRQSDEQVLGRAAWDAAQPQEAGVGLWGFVLHASSNLHGPSVHPFQNFVCGAPPMAPLLFPNLIVLRVIGLWQMRVLQTD